jgi:hypothetical protein
MKSSYAHKDWDANQLGKANAVNMKDESDLGTSQKVIKSMQPTYTSTYAIDTDTETEMTRARTLCSVLIRL